MDIDKQIESYLHACACVEGLIESGQKAYSVAVNPEKIYRAEHDRQLALPKFIGVCHD